MAEIKIDRTLSGGEGIPLFARKMNSEIAQSFKALMETKGLYQAVQIDRESAVKFAKEWVLTGYFNEFESLLERRYPLKRNLTLSEAALYAAGRDGANEELLVLAPVNVKMFCMKCDRDEAFKPLLYQDVTNEMSKATLGQAGTAKKLPNVGEGYQVFTFAYQCQSCLGLPEVFLIQRAGLKLAIHGRSPIQSMAVPAFIPKPESKWYREAVIATKVGRTLAGIFYLRTFIEQFARRVTDIGGRRPGDEILSEYSDTLPDPPRDAMPSLREWYGKLSEAIHSANEDGELLQKAFEEVDRHFEFRKLYKMPESPPMKPAPDPGVATSTEQA
jgi:hypothetical protein